MRERVIKIGVLSTVFILAIIVFSHITNRGNADMTADMNVATLPTISFQVEGQDVNLLSGHKNEMNLVSVRDEIVPYKASTGITATVNHGEIDSVQYKITSLDGKEELQTGNVEKVGETFSIPIEDAVANGEEYLLTMQAEVEKESIYYYTRIVEESNLYAAESIDFVKELHTAMIEKNDEELLTRVMEPNGEGNNYSLQHVTIHSDVKHAMWGSLQPEVVSDIQWEIKEMKEAYVSIQLRYQVACAGDDNEEEIYQVSEFFKVANGTERMYLISYDRIVNEIFNAKNKVLSGKGILLGLAAEDIPYRVNQEGTIVSFIQENELWSYSIEEDAFALVFSFAESEKEDVRHYINDHKIQILSMEENGNLTFSVYGYMNRGIHEGETGLSIYYYKLSQNSVEEKIFIPCTDNYLVIEEEWNKLAYYNQSQDVLYVMVGEQLQKIDLQKETSEILLEGLKENQYVASDDGHLFAYQQDGVHVWNFNEDTQYHVTGEEGETVVPLGFILNDFVYGITREENLGYDTAGQTIQGIECLEIRSEKNKVVKTYEIADTYILDVDIDGNMITLKRGVKNGSLYQEISEDYITNNEESGNEYVSMKAYWTDLKENQYRLQFSQGIQDRKAKTMKPKLVLQEQVTQLETRSSSKEYYYAYGNGELLGIYLNAGDAIAIADEYAGVVVTSQQNYAWEDGNQVSWYRNFNVNGFTAQGGETTLEACVRKVLTYEGVSAEVSAALKEQAVEDVMEAQLSKEVIRYRDCSSKDMRYLIDKGVPVIAMINADDAVLLVGYDALTVTYISPSNGAVRSATFAKMDEMLEGSGCTFIGYVR